MRVLLYAESIFPVKADVRCCISLLISSWEFIISTPVKNDTRRTEIQHMMWYCETWNIMLTDGLFSAENGTWPTFFSPANFRYFYIRAPWYFQTSRHLSYYLQVLIWFFSRAYLIYLDIIICIYHGSCFAS